LSSSKKAGDTTSRSRRKRGDGLSQPRTGNLPLGSVLAPESHTILLTVATMLLVQFYQTDAEVGPSSLHSLIVHPLILAIRLGLGIVRAPSQAWVPGASVGCSTDQQAYSKLGHGTKLPVDSKASWMVRICRRAWFLVTETSRKGRARGVAHLRVERLEQLFLHVPGPVHSGPSRLLGAGKRDGVGSALGGFLRQLFGASEEGWLGEQHLVLPPSESSVPFGRRRSISRGL